MLNKIKWHRNYCRLFLSTILTVEKEDSCKDSSNSSKDFDCKRKSKWYFWKTKTWDSSSEIEEEFHEVNLQFSRDVVVEQKCRRDVIKIASNIKLNFPSKRIPLYTRTSTCGQWEQWWSQVAVLAGAQENDTWEILTMRRLFTNLLHSAHNEIHTWQS